MQQQEFNAAINTAFPGLAFLPDPEGPWYVRVHSADEALSVHNWLTQQGFEPNYTGGRGVIERLIVYATINGVEVLKNAIVVYIPPGLEPVGSRTTAQLMAEWRALVAS